MKEHCAVGFHGGVSADTSGRKTLQLEIRNKLIEDYRWSEGFAESDSKVYDWNRTPYESTGTEQE